MFLQKGNTFPRCCLLPYKGMESKPKKGAGGEPNPNPEHINKEYIEIITNILQCQSNLQATSPDLTTWTSNPNQLLKVVGPKAHKQTRCKQNKARKVDKCPKVKNKGIQQYRAISQ